MVIVDPVFVNPAKTYDFDTHRLSVDRVSLNSAHRSSDGVVRVSLAVEGEVVAKGGFLAKLGMKPKPQKYYLSLGYRVSFDSQVVSDYSFVGLNVGKVQEDSKYLVRSSSLEELVSKGIKTTKGFALVTESFNVIKPNLYSDIMLYTERMANSRKRRESPWNK